MGETCAAPAEILESIRQNVILVKIVIHQRYDLHLALDEVAIKFLDRYIEQSRADLDSQARAGLINTLGAFLGETIRTNYTGEWIMQGDTPAIRLGNDLILFPFDAVAKQISNGHENSILGFYRTIAPMQNQFT